MALVLNMQISITARELERFILFTSVPCMNRNPESIPSKYNRKPKASRGPHQPPQASLIYSSRDIHANLCLRSRRVFPSFLWLDDIAVFRNPANTELSMRSYIMLTAGSNIEGYGGLCGCRVARSRVLTLHGRFTSRGPPGTMYVSSSRPQRLRKLSHPWFEGAVGSVVERASCL